MFRVWHATSSLRRAACRARVRKLAPPPANSWQAGSRSCSLAPSQGTAPAGWQAPAMPGTLELGSNAGSRRRRGREARRGQRRACKALRRSYWSASNISVLQDSPCELLPACSLSAASSEDFTGTQASKILRARARSTLISTPKHEHSKQAAIYRPVPSQRPAAVEQTGRAPNWAANALSLPPGSMQARGAPPRDAEQQVRAGSGACGPLRCRQPPLYAPYHCHATLRCRRGPQRPCRCHPARDQKAPAPGCPAARRPRHCSP